MKKLSVTALLLSVCAFAHVTVRPSESAPGQEQRYTMRVPTEKQVPTVSVQLEFPTSITVITVDEITGWKLELNRSKEGRIVSATWRGSLPPQATAEFTFLARNPATGVIRWNAIQTYQDGSKVEWTGAKGTRSPASETTISTK